MIWATGSVHEGTGRQTVGTTADRFLEKPAEFLWSLSEPQFQHMPPEECPLPRRAAFVAGLSALLDAPPESNLGALEAPDFGRSSETNIQQHVSGIGDVESSGAPELRNRLRGGVFEGEP